MANPRHRVSGPTFAPAPFGILTVAQVIDDPDPHWRNGVRWEDGVVPPAKATLSPCYPVVDPEGDPGDVIDAEPVTKTPSTDGVDEFTGEAFTLYAMHECAAIGRTVQEDRDRAARLLTNGEARGLDAVIVTGETEAGTLPTALANAENVGAMVTTLGVIVRLEEALRLRYGGVGVIWLPVPIATAAFADNLLVVNNGRVTTHLGTPVAVLSVDTEDAGVHWGYATGAVSIYRGPVVPIEGFDHTVNRSAVIAERSYAVAYDDTGDGGIPVRAGVFASVIDQED